MTVTSTVRSGETPSGVEVSGNVEDTSGGGGYDQDVEVLMAVDSTLVSLDSAKPAVYKKSTSGGHIQLWWKLKLKPNGKWPFRVKLKCKKGAHGPTPVGLAICSQASMPKSQHRFHTTTYTIYHGHTCRGKRGKGPTFS